MQVLPLGDKLSSTIIQAWLEKANRAVTAPQWAIVNEAISKCSFPLFVKLVFDEICRWKSYTKPAQTVLAFTIHETILRLYERIETQHGKYKHGALISTSSDGVKTQTHTRLKRTMFINERRSCVKVEADVLGSRESLINLRFLWT